MKTTKDQAKRAVESYGNLLKEYGIISDIESEELRGKIFYTFIIEGTRYPHAVCCEGIKELSNVLTSMWTVFERARQDIGLETASVFVPQQYV